MSRSSFRAKAILGGIFSIAVAVAPLSLAAASRPAVIPNGAHTARPFLAAQPRTFPPAQQTYTVNTMNDTDAASPAGGACADSAGQCSIRAALDVANAIDQTVTINIPAGNYQLTIGELNVTDPAGVQFAGAGATSTTIVGAANDDVLDVGTAPAPASVGGFAQLTNVTLSGGTGVSVDSTNATLEMDGAGVTGSNFSGEGAGVLNEGQFWATDSAFTNNHATDEGGAIYDAEGSIRLDGDTFSGNTSGEEGGAIAQDDGPISVDNSTFNANSVTNAASDAYGGAIYASDEMELTNDVFTGNSAVSTDSGGEGFGGGVFDAYGLNSVVGSTFIGNSVSGTGVTDNEGGAFYDDSSVTISGSTFQGNLATLGNGGAIAEEDEGLTLSDDTVSGNTATGTSGNGGYGGGVYARDISNISNTTIGGNHADSGGGGLYLSDGMILNSSLVSGNTSTLGAGIYSSWSVQATGSAIVDNVASGASNAGGGIYISANAANRADFEAVTVAGNVAASGAGFALASTSGSNQGAGGTLTNSTVADNRTSTGVEQDCAEIGPAPQGLPLGSAGGNVVGDATCGFVTSSDRQGAGAQGYWETATDGGIFNYNAGFFGSMGGKPLNKPVVGLAHTPGNQGYWEVASDGGVFSFGDASFFGSMGGKPLNAPMVGIASMPDGAGYVEVAADGGVFSFGDAGFYGSMGGKPLNKPIVGIAVTPDGRGYWEVASDGGVFNFGDAGFYGSMGGKPLNKPIVGIASATDGAGYDEVASDGGVFNFGSAGFYGSAGSLHLNAPVVGIATAPDNRGYWTFAADGGVFNYGTGAAFKGSAGSVHLNKPVVGGVGT